MSNTAVTVKADIPTGLDSQTRAAAERELGEMWIAFEEAMRGPSLSAPGAGVWPVGLIVNEGPHEYYSPKGRRSARSLQAWRPQQRGLSIKFVNEAQSGRGRLYSEHAHKSDDDAGQALHDARRIFENLADLTIQNIADLVAGALNG